LAGSQPLGSGSFECSHPRLIMSRTEVLDFARPASRRPHDLHHLAPEEVFTVRT